MAPLALLANLAIRSEPLALFANWATKCHNLHRFYSWSSGGTLVSKTVHQVAPHSMHYAVDALSASCQRFLDMSFLLESQRYCRDGTLCTGMVTRGQRPPAEGRAMGNRQELCVAATSLLRPSGPLAVTVAHQPFSEQQIAKEEITFQAI